MDVIRRRMLVSSLIEKMDQEPLFSKKLGLKNESVFVYSISASYGNHIGEKKGKEEKS